MCPRIACLESIVARVGTESSGGGHLSVYAISIFYFSCSILRFRHLVMCKKSNYANNWMMNSEQ